MSEIRTYYIKAFASANGYTGDNLAEHLENGPLYTDEAGVAVDVTDEIERLRLALAEATRDMEAMQVYGQEQRDRAVRAERERDEARALAVSWEREFNVANHERLRLWDEAESFREKLDQFEANGFPNVASVLDRIAVLSRARETGGAVREAKERLWDALDRESLGGTYLAARGLRAALSSPPRPETKDDVTVIDYGHRDFVTCGDESSRCPPPPADAPAFTHWTGSATRPDAPPADAATEAVNRLSPIATEPVARAAEIVRERLRIYGNTSTYLYDCPGLVAEVTDLLDALALSTPAPAPSADRCAAGHDWIRRGEGSCGDRYVCLRCGERKP